MAGSLGLINSYRKLIAEPLKNYRGGDKNGGHEVDLEIFCQKHAKNLEGGYGLKNALGEPLTMEDIWKDIGLDPERSTLDNLLTLSDDIKYFSPGRMPG